MDTFRLLSAAAFLLLSACDSMLPPILCTKELRAGLVVNVFDAATGASAAENALALAIDGAFVDTLEVVYAGRAVATGFAGAYERAGRYDVVVRKEGYAEWTAREVRVTRDECHVQTVTLDALLERQ